MKFLNNVSINGNAQISALQGSGSRMVIVDPAGFLSTQSIPSIPTDYISNNPANSLPRDSTSFHSITDANSIEQSFTYWNASTNTNTPVGFGEGIGITGISPNGTQAGQIVLDKTTNALSFRGKATNVWKAWRTVETIDNKIDGLGSNLDATHYISGKAIDEWGFIWRGSFNGSAIDIDATAKIGAYTLVGSLLGTLPSNYNPSLNSTLVVYSRANGGIIWTYQTITQTDGASWWRHSNVNGNWSTWKQYADRDWVTSQGFLTFETDPVYTADKPNIIFSGDNNSLLNNDAGYITSASIPTVNDATLTLSATGIATGSQTFTANSATNKNFTVNVPGTNVGGSFNTNNNVLTLTSSTGNGTTVNLSGLFDGELIREAGSGTNYGWRLKGQQGSKAPLGDRDIDFTIDRGGTGYGPQGGQSVAFGELQKISADARLVFVAGAEHDIQGDADRSAAFGLANTITTDGAGGFAQGWASVVSGQWGAAFIKGHAGGIYSFAAGLGARAESYAEIALGEYTTAYTPNSTSSNNSSDRIFVIGNGTSSSNRSDALTILKSGQTTISHLSGTGTRMVTANANGVLSTQSIPTSPNYTAGVGIRLNSTVFDVIRTTTGSGNMVTDVTQTTNGYLVHYASAPSVNNSTITLSAGTGLNGGGNFTLNQSTNSTITFNHGNHTGDVTGSTTLTIANNAVTFPKIVNIPTKTLMGRYSSGTGNVQSITLGNGLTLNGSGVLSATNTSNGTVTSVGAGNGMNFTTITGSGNVTLGTPGAITLSSTNSVTATSHTHAFNPGGSTSQYIRGNGTLATFPTIPAPTDYYLSTDPTNNVSRGNTNSFNITDANDIEQSIIWWNPGLLNIPGTFTSGIGLSAYSPDHTAGLQFIFDKDDLRPYLRGRSSSIWDATWKELAFTSDIVGTDLGTTTDSGRITSSTGAATRLTSLYRDALNPSDDAFMNRPTGTWTYVKATTNTGFPDNSYGGGITFIRNANSVSGRWDLYNYNGSHDLWYSAGGSAWDKICGKDYADERYTRQAGSGGSFTMLAETETSQRTTLEAINDVKRGMELRFKNRATLPGVSGGTYASLLNINTYTDPTGNSNAAQLAFSTTGVWWRGQTDWTNNNAFRKLAFTDDIPSTPNLNQVTTVGNISNNDIEIRTGSQSASYYLRLGSYNPNYTNPTITAKSSSGGTGLLFRGAANASAPSRGAFVLEGYQPDMTSAITGGNLFRLSNGDNATGSVLDVSWNGEVTMPFLSGSGTGMVVANSSGVLSKQSIPTIPTVNDGTLTLATAGIATGSQTFTANSATNKTFTVNVPGTNLGSSISGNTLSITSSTGSNTSVTLPGTPNLQQVTDVGSVTTTPIIVNSTAAVPQFSLFTISNSVNGGYMAFQNRTTNGSEFTPFVYAKSAGQTNYGTGYIMSGSDAGWDRGFMISARNAAGNGAVTGGNLLTVDNNGSQFLKVSYNGQITLAGLSGTSTRMVVANATGVLSTQAIPSSGVTSITIGNGLTGSSPITSTGTVTLGTPGNITLSSTNSVSASSHTHSFNPGGTTAQYIRGNGTLATFPAIPQEIINNGYNYGTSSDYPIGWDTAGGFAANAVYITTTGVYTVQPDDYTVYCAVSGIAVALPSASDFVHRMIRIVNSHRFETSFNGEILDYNEAAITAISDSGSLLIQSIRGMGSTYHWYAVGGNLL